MKPIELFALLLWVASYAFESIADNQKKDFVVKMVKKGDKTAVCDVGLWYYSRHPNYFGEWMVWNSLIIFSIPSALNLGLPTI